jgi:hypothetical protein
MELTRTSSVSNYINNQRDKTLFHLDERMNDFHGTDNVLKAFTKENCEDFYSYVDWLGLAKDPDLIVLPSTHHYYYDNDDLQNVKTVVNLKQLNRINQLKVYLHTFFHLLPPKSFFIGCFTDSNKKSGNNIISNYNFSDRFDPFDNGIASRNHFINMVYNILDSKTNRSLNKRSVQLLLEDHGFKVADMTELNGITYFCTRKVQLASD